MLFRHWSLNLLVGSRLIRRSHIDQPISPGYYTWLPCHVPISVLCRTWATRIFAPEARAPRNRPHTPTPRPGKTTTISFVPLRKQPRPTSVASSRDDPVKRESLVKIFSTEPCCFSTCDSLESWGSVHPAVYACWHASPFTRVHARLTADSFFKGREEASFRKMAICNQHFSFFVNFLSLILHNRTPFIWTLNLSGNSSLYVRCNWSSCNRSSLIFHSICYFLVT